MLNPMASDRICASRLHLHLDLPHTHTHTLTHIPEGCAAVLKKRGLLFLPV